MRNLVNPQQTQLFDPFDSVLTEKPAHASSTVGTVLSGISSLS